MEEEKNVYAKRPLWQWVVIYAVIGVVVYGIIYYFFLANKNVNPYTSSAVPNSAVTISPAVTEVQKSGEEVSVFLTPSGFVPSELTINNGAKVIWVNQSGVTGNVSSAPHPAHTAYPPLNLGSFEPSQSVSLVFDTPGTYKYHNHLQPSQTASVIVK